MPEGQKEASFILRLHKHLVAMVAVGPEFVTGRIWKDMTVSLTDIIS
jgi:hypothetical protein